MKKDKLIIKIRIDDLIMELAHTKFVNPKLYYKLLPHLKSMKKILKPFYNKWLDN